MKIKASKMKDSKPNFLILLCVGSIIFCGLFYYMVDIVWNGSFVDWFMQKYMITHEVYSEDVGRKIVVTEPLWPQLKVLFFALFTVTVMGCVSAAMFVSDHHAKAEVRRSITRTARMIHEFMLDNKSEIFPKEYAEISARMLEISADMQRHERLLKEEAERKNDLTAYLAHDLKTPLTSVIGYLTLLKEASDMPKEQRVRYVDIAARKAQRLEMLINEFFEISRYNLNQIELEKETIDLSYMLIQMTDEFYPLLTSHKNTVNLRVDENLTVYGDGIKLARVFNNILKNAIAYSYPDTEIDIWAEKNRTEVVLFIRNYGKTIPAQKLHVIFEKFFRLDEARTADTGGAGLGLAIAREIVTLHGGKISADSENERTVFRVSLPV